MASYRHPINIERLQDLPSQLRMTLRLDQSVVTDFVRILLALSGTQIEGDEISCCLLLPKQHARLELHGVPIPRPQDFPAAFVEPFKPGTGQHFARNIRRLRDTVGRTGDAVDLVVVLSDKGGIEQLILLGSQEDPWTLSAAGQVIHLRPRGSLWILDGGDSEKQILRLRDGTGWTLRDLKTEVALFRHLFGARYSETFGRTVIKAAWRASQQGRGASMLIVDLDFDAYRTACDAGGDDAPRRRLHLPVPIPFRHHRELMRLAVLDGSTLVTEVSEGGAGHPGASQPQILDACAYFLTPGGRHESAAHVVRCVDWVRGAIVVSEDGPITWFKDDNGPQVVGGDNVRWI